MLYFAFALWFQLFRHFFCAIIVMFVPLFFCFLLHCHGFAFWSLNLYLLFYFLALKIPKSDWSKSYLGWTGLSGTFSKVHQITFWLHHHFHQSHLLGAPLLTVLDSFSDLGVLVELKCCSMFINHYQTFSIKCWNHLWNSVLSAPKSKLWYQSILDSY